MLVNYFKRNHDYRNGLLTFNKKMLAYAPAILDYNDENGQEQLIGNFIIQANNFYDGEQINFIRANLNNSQSDNAYLTELKDYYEWVYYNGHGAPNFHQVQINPINIFETEPNALFYEINSCNVGKFSEGDYMAGYYLFSGNSLVAYAATEPITVQVASPNNLPLFLLTKAGSDFDLAFKEPYRGNLIDTALHILGDPTLKMRYDIQKTNLTIEPQKIDLGTFSHCPEDDPCQYGEQLSFNIRISNNGPNKAVIHHQGLTPISEIGVPYRISFNTGEVTFPLTLEPNEDITIIATTNIPPIPTKVDRLLKFYSNSNEVTQEIEIIGEAT